MNIFVAIQDWGYNGGISILGIYESYESAHEKCWCEWDHCSSLYSSLYVEVWEVSK